MAQENIKSKYPPIRGIGTLVREGAIQFVRIDKSVFHKTPEERIRLANAKASNKRAVIKAGLDPKKVLNAQPIKML